MQESFRNNEFQHMQSNLHNLGFTFFITALLCCYSCNISGDIEEAVDEFRQLREQSIFAIDEAIVGIQNGLMSSKDALNALGRQLDGSVQDILVYNVPYILDRLTGEGAAVGFCAVDFGANRAVHYLRIMKAELLTGKLPEPAPPTICQSSINAIDLNAPFNLRSIISIYGYDFLKKDSFQVFLVDNEGAVLELENSLQFQTEYEFTINLSPYEDAFLSKWNYLSLSYSADEVFAISILQTQEIPPQTETKYIAISKFGFTPVHTGGDADFEKHGPQVVVHARLRHNRKQAYLQIYMLAEETRSDWTTAAGWSPNHYFYTAPEGWHIEKIEGETDFQNLVSYIDNDQEVDIHYTTLGEANIMGDGEGDDAGVHTNISFNFAYQVPVIITED